MDQTSFLEVFFSSLKTAPPHSLSKYLDLYEEAIVSHYLDLCPIQDSFRFRARYIGLKAAHLLIDEKGELNRENLARLNQWLEKENFLFGPQREGDALIYSHLAFSLKLLVEIPEIWSWIRKFSPPLVHKKAEEFIRETLWPETIKMVQAIHIRKAVLASWLTLLRQTTGSCFATAPAILIQKKYPLQFLKDLYDLLTIGRLKRIISGKEYSVPLSPSSGAMDLQKPIFVPWETLCFSPGLMAALEVAGIHLGERIEEKISHLHRILEGKESPSLTIEKLLRSLLLEFCELTEEDIESEEYLSRIQMTPLLAKNTAVYYQKPSERAQRVSDWKKKLAKAYGTFQSFTECTLLRCWEYSLASFCDVKIEFARWNLYVGLGLDSEEKGGIGYFLYQQIDFHLQKCNEEVASFHREYEQALGAARATESLIYSTLSDAQRNQLKAELASYVQAANTILELRDRAIQKAEALAGLFSSLIRQYDQKLQEYFQELFDPSLFGESAHLYEDSPAGFRLVYKHGRIDSSQWTRIRDGEGYISCLRDFFSTTENDLEILPQLDRELITSLITSLIQFIQEPEFLESAIYRAKQKGRESPWDYISGGTMETLLQAYCGRDRPFTEASLIAHSEEELLNFFMNEGREDPLLVHSPTHAFILHTALLPKNVEQAIRQNREWIRKWKLNDLIQEHLSHRMSEKLPNEERPLFLHLYRQKNVSQTIDQFRIALIESLQSIKESRIKNRAALVDSLLFEQIPVLSLEQAQEAVRSILRLISDRFSLKALRIEEIVKQLEGSFFGSLEIQQKVKEGLFRYLKTPFSNVDWDKEIANASRMLGWCYPHSLQCADSNWSGWNFGFVINPATQRLEFWRLNRTGMQGYPMNDWQEWISPKSKAPWVLLTRSKEYMDAFL